MKLPVIIAAATFAALVPSPAAAGAASADSAAAQSLSVPPPGLDPLAPRGYFLRDGLDAPGTGYLSLSLSTSFSMQWYRPPTRFDAVTRGAGSAATVGMFLGAVGNTLGWFDESTTWWLTGSLAAVGAVYAGTHYEPQPLLRIRWSPGGDEPK